jgi:hypothetical protein
MATKKQAYDAYRPRLDFSPEFYRFLEERTTYTHDELRQFFDANEPFITKSVCKGYAVYVLGLGTFTPTKDSEGELSWTFHVDSRQSDFEPDPERTRTIPGIGGPSIN